jgi:hypothetical protein
MANGWKERQKRKEEKCEEKEKKGEEARALLNG